MSKPICCECLKEIDDGCGLRCDYCSRPMCRECYELSAGECTDCHESDDEEEENEEEDEDE